jgi:hypothetical protein
LCNPANGKVGPALLKHLPNVYTSGSDVWTFGLRLQGKGENIALRQLHHFHGEGNDTQRPAAIPIQEEEGGLCAGLSQENGRPFNGGWWRSYWGRRGFLLRGSLVDFECGHDIFPPLQFTFWVLKPDERVLRIDHGQRINNEVSEGLPACSGVGIKQPVCDAPCLSQGLIDIAFERVNSLPYAERFVGLQRGSVGWVKADCKRK